MVREALPTYGPARGGQAGALAEAATARGLVPRPAVLRAAATWATLLLATRLPRAGARLPQGAAGRALSPAEGLLLPSGIRC